MARIRLRPGTMEGLSGAAMPSEEVLFHDGLGDRILARDSHRKPLHESLLIRAELSGVPPFEFSLTQRVGELESFDHPSFVKVHRLVRIPGRLPRLSVVSAPSGGVRLSELLAAAEPIAALRSPGAALFITQQLLDALAVLHRQGPDVSHGAIAPERIVITAGSVRITDYVLGSAIAQLRFSPERYWQELRVAVPPSPGVPKIDRGTDITQVGMVAVALFAGRPLRPAEHVVGLVGELAGLPTPQPVRGWIERALQLDPQRAFVSAVDARRALDHTMAEAGLTATRLGSDVGKGRPSYAGVVSPRPAPSTLRPPLPRAKPVVRSAPAGGTMFNGDINRRTEVHAGGRQPAGVRSGRFTARLKTLLKVGVLGASIAGAFTAAQYLPPPAEVFSEDSTLTIDSHPRGVELLIDHETRGVTPTTVKLKSGRHDVELRASDENRIFSIFLPRGGNVSQYVELAPPAGGAARRKK